MEGGRKQINFGPPVIVGLKAEEGHGIAVAPTQIQLLGGIPLYYLLLEKEPPWIVLPEEAQAARDGLQRLFELDPVAIRSCQGKTKDQAREIIKRIRQ